MFAGGGGGEGGGVSARACACARARGGVNAPGVMALTERRWLVVWDEQQCDLSVQPSVGPRGEDISDGPPAFTLPC